MSRRKSFHGTTLDEALSAACAGLGSRLEELHYDVVDGEGGDVVVEAEVDPIAVLGLFLSESFRAGDLEITARCNNDCRHWGVYSSVFASCAPGR